MTYEKPSTIITEKPENENVLLKKKETMLNTLHSEHLAEEYKPIIASICRWEDLVSFGDSEETIRERLERMEIEGEYIDFNSDIENLSKMDISNAGEETYLISRITNKDKLSINYKGCTGVIAVGVDKKSGEQISFMTHQEPNEAFVKHEKEFKIDFTKKLQLLQEMSVDDSVDVIILGGNFFNSIDRSSYDYESVKSGTDILSLKLDFQNMLNALNRNGYKSTYQENYKKSIAILGGMIIDVMGFEPVVMTGPNIVWNSATDAYFDTQKRRLYIIREEQSCGTDNESYLPSNLDKKILGMQKKNEE